MEYCGLNLNFDYMEKRIVIIGIIMWGRTFQLTLISYVVMVVLMMASFHHCIEQAASEEAEDPDIVKGKIQGKIPPIDAYIRLFEQKRSMQLEAVKSIQKFSKYEQKYKLIETMVKQIFEVIDGCKNNLTEWGFIPGDPIPEDTTIRDGVSKVLESTAMFGELVLRQPDITHLIYSKHKDWEFIIGWAVWFSMESSVFRGSHLKLLNLMGQELSLLPKDENYVNPYRESAQMQDEEDAIEEAVKKAIKKAKKKKTKEKKKGPRLSGTTHTEL